MSLFKHSRALYSEKYQKKKRKKLAIIFFLSTLCIFTVLASFILFLRLPLFKIDKIEVNGISLLTREDIERETLSILEKGQERIIFQTNIFFFGKNKIEEFLKEKFKEIKDISIKRSGFGEITLKIEEKIPSGIVCSGFHGDNDISDCYYTDDTGFIFKKIEKDSPLPHYYIPIDKTNINIGSNFIDQEKFRELQGFLYAIEKNGVSSTGLLIGDNGEYEMYVKNDLKNEKDTTTPFITTVYFDDRSPLEDILANFLAFWQNNKEKARSGKATSLNYINLRFGNVIYYSTK
ncbi:MAG TPA: FtsQ-type POTRA domain-containing protein [Candidatus Paceibacterota bacterium]